MLIFFNLSLSSCLSPIKPMYALLISLKISFLLNCLIWSCSSKYLMASIAITVRSKPEHQLLTNASKLIYFLSVFRCSLVFNLSLVSRVFWVSFGANNNNRFRRFHFSSNCLCHNEFREQKEHDFFLSWTFV